jgi:hypothetical protein
MRIGCFNVIIDGLIVELNRRSVLNYAEVSKTFGFLWRLHEMDNNAIIQCPLN